MSYPLMPAPLRRWLAGVLAVLMELGPLMSPAYAALTPLGDEPLNTRNSSKPNIVLTVDDSTSMLDDFLPDFVIGNFCRGGTGGMTSACGNAGATVDATNDGKWTTRYDCGGGDFSCGGLATNPNYGAKYFSPGYVFEQYGYPYPQYGGGYDTSGPGAGCSGGAGPCFHGVDPGPLPGISTYPNPGIGTSVDHTIPSGWSYAGNPYEYWLLWPAPAHSAAINTIYYDPRLTYDPPVDSTGASYPQQDRGTTTSWTKVVADPWASTITYVDLTSRVTDGLWCNSDWNLDLDWSNGYLGISAATRGQRCRYNGTGAAAFSTVTASQGADYTYPWAPPSFSVSASPGTTTLTSYAAQKVTLDATTLTGTAVTAAWANAKDSKYFYENENMLWCDVTSPSWPQTGVGQACGSFQNQVCSGTKQTCDKDPGNCSGNPTGASCGGLVQGTCNNALCTGGTTGTCSGAVPGVCSFGSCTNKNAQVCNGTHQTCNGVAAQSCSGPVNQTCNLPGTQTCQPPVCGVTYDPPGCNLLPPGPENPCNATTTCAPPVCTPNPGTCSITKATCTSDSQCPAQPGVCSVTGASCTAPIDCGSVGHCSIDTGTICSNDNDCPIKGGTCSIKTSVACSKNTDCPNAGHCSNAGSTVCLLDTDCGLCNNPGGKSCTASAQCTSINGSCNTKICSGGNKAGIPCTQNSQCTGGGTCTAIACAQNGANVNCPVSGGTCQQNGSPCTLSTQCQGTCSKSNGQPWSQKSCSGATQAAADAQCRTNGTCAQPTGTVCTTACTNLNWNVNGIDTSCGCQAQFGTCKGTKLTPPPACFQTACNQGQTQFCCSNILTCSGTHSTCSSAVDCPDISPICSITSVSCTDPSTGKPNSALCPPIGKCGPVGGPFNGAQCTTSSTCQGPVAPATLTCSSLEADGVTALRQDAENAGVACRHNNKAYPDGTAAAPYNYPSGKYITPITGGNDANACTTTDHLASTPRHYWKAEVQWCDKLIANTSTTSDQWAGYGTDAGGTCQPGYDSTTNHIYPRFFQFGSASYVNNYTTPAFQRVDLDINASPLPSYTHTWVDATGQTQTITRSFDEEMTNYANWFAYYRTRILAVKTVTSLAFTALDDQFRVGFHTMSNGLTTSAAQSDPAQFVDVQDFDSTQKAAWWKQLFAITIPLGLETPTLDAMERIGEYFSPGGSSQLPSGTDPIIQSCQKNWHMLFTDGFTNQDKPTGVVGDNDDTIPTLPEPVTGLTTGSPWPAPFRENSTQLLPNAASDYAMHYWATDLRPSGPFSDDNVPTTAKDPASWQHLNFAAMSLGTQGKLPNANQSLTEQQLANGTLQWPVITPFCNPVVSPSYCTVANRPDNSGVDDLWHAAINGRGRFVNAQTAAELKLGMGQILEDITNQAGARAGVGLASSTISASNHAVYRVTFQPGWAGTLTKLNIDLSTGTELNPALWEGSSQLAGQLANTDPACVAAITDTAGNGSATCPWFTNRRVFTVADDNGGGPGSAVPFLWNNLSSTQQDSLAPGNAAVGQAVLEWLRGNASNEGAALGQFRVRSTLTDPITGAQYEDFLGDIVDSQAVYVGPPNFPYLDSNDPGYSTFVAAKQNRPAQVYAAANDGMVHAFNDDTGSENWAFIPHDLYRPDATGLGALAYQDGALPPFRHHYYVDSTPRIFDANFGGGSGDWHTLLVGGLGKGGKSYYAIDVTDPGSFDTEANAASHYLWTFTDPHMGYTYGRPMIAKTRAFGGRWLAVVAAGYNNANGAGTIFFLDAQTGAKLKEMNTTFGDATTPAGLAHIAGYTQDFHNQLIEQIYGGDLYGHVWRFDVSSSDDTQWSVQQIAYLTDPSGQPQPVTTEPALDIDVQNGVDRWIFVGTGRLLDPSDLTDPDPPQQQTLYAIRDGTITSPDATVPSPNGWQPRTDFVALADKVNGLSGKPTHGWYDDLPAGERIVTQPKAALSIIAYAGTAAQDNPCLTGEPATLYAREFSLGESLLAGGVAGIPEASGIVGLDIVVFSTTNNETGTPDLRALITMGTGASAAPPINLPPGLAAHRMSWRLLGQ